MNTPKHNGKTIKPGHYYGGGGGGCYSEGFPIHLAGAREKPRKRCASVAFGVLLLVLAFAAGHAAAGDDADQPCTYTSTHCWIVYQSGSGGSENRKHQDRAKVMIIGAGVAYGLTRLHRRSVCKKNPDDSRCPR